jgi:hypothetical protein
LGHSCYVQIIHKKDGNGKIVSLAPPDKRTKDLKQVHDKVYFSFEEGGEIPDAVPDGIKKIIMKSREYNETGQQGEGYYPDQEPQEPVHEEDNIPF